MHYRVLGPLAVVSEDGRERSLGGPRQKLVLATLLIAAGHAVPVDAAVDAVWGARPPETARATLQSYISRLRQELGTDSITRDGDGYRLLLDDGALDSARFEALLADGRRRIGEDGAAAGRLLRESLELWYGRPYAGAEASPVVDAEVTRLSELRMVAVETRIDADLAVGSHADVVAELESLVREHPLRERFRAQQMRALAGTGRQAEALQAFTRYRQLLVEEMGLDPSSELQDLERRILAQDPSVTVARPQRGSSAVPAVGRPRPSTGGGDTARGYELRGTIGTGDFGVVHRAFQPSVGREVAVKQIRPDYANRPDFVRRFEQEAQLIADLEHPHIVPLHDFWRDPGGAYLVMPLLRGGSLATALARGGWHLGPALKLLDQVGGALGYAHRHGVVHRDVKPANVLLDAESNAYLSDFGIAVRDTDEVGVPLATSPTYVPPEEARGHSAGPAGDVFGLGVLTWHLLTGSTPPTVRPLPPVSAARNDIPAALDEVLARATEVRPERRFDRVEAFVRAVRQACGADVVGVSLQEHPPDGPLRNPYKGLRAFRETDAGDFFGREAVINELLAAVAEKPVTLVVGPSGSGKSSVVRAGLVPALRAGRIRGSREWLVTDMFPGSYPFEELEAALLRVAVDAPAVPFGDLADPRGLVRASKLLLPDDGSVLLLVVDQFEELFSSVSSEQMRRAFLDNLVAVAADERSRIRVVATIRADFFDRPLGYGSFAQAIADSVVTVGMPTRDGLAQAIAGPAQRVGIDVEPGLISRITADVESQPGGLPLLQYALTELFARHDGGELTVAGYEATGGVLGALTRRAEDLYEGLTEPAREAARQVLLRLVTVQEGTADTRRRARRSELLGLRVDAALVDDVLHQFGSYRLLSFDQDPVTRGPTVEVAHEALLTCWDRLQGWIDSHRDELTLQRRLSTAAREWEAADRDPSYLLRGARLTDTAASAAEGALVLTVDERAYLDTSLAQRDTEEAAAARRRRGTLVGLSLVLVVVTLAAAIALIQRAAAREQALQARVRELAGEARLAIDEDPQLALHLALEAVASTDRAGRSALPEAMAALHEAAQASRVTDIVDVDGHAVHLTADGLLGVQHDNGAVTVTDVITGQVTPLDLPWAQWATLRATPGREVMTLVGTRDPEGPSTAAVVDDGGPRVLADGPPGDVGPSALSGDGRRLAALLCSPRPDECPGADLVAVWDVTAGELIGAWTPARSMGSVVFLPDGDLVVAAADPAELLILDPATGDVRRSRPLREGLFPLLSLSPDGSRIAVAASGGEGGDVVAIHRTDDLVEELTFGSFGDQGTAWSPDGTQLALTGVSGVVRVFDATTGQMVRALPGSTDNAQGIAWPSADRIVQLELDEIYIYDVSPSGPGEVGAVALRTGPPWGFDADPQRGWLVATTSGGLEVHDLATGEPIAIVERQRIDLATGDRAADASFTHALGFGQDGTSSLLALPDLQEVAALPRCRAPLAVTPDGARVALNPWTCSDAPPDGAAAGLQVIDVATQEVQYESATMPAGAFSAAFSPAGPAEAGRYLAATNQEVLELIDTTTWRSIGMLHIADVDPDGGGLLIVNWDPGGGHLVFGISSGRTVVIDVAQVVAGREMIDAVVFNRVTNTGAAPDPSMNAGLGLVATHGFDATLRLWDLDTQELRIELDTGADALPPITLAGDGSAVFYPSPDAVVRRFPLDRDAAVETAAALLVREMTADECARHAIDPCPVRLDD